MTDRVAHGKALPAEVVEQVVAKTDGVPLFVEELTKMVLESGLLQEREDRYELTSPLPSLAIPTTLHDSLMARLDRLATVKSLAQLGALGREFSYALLHAVSPGTRRPCNGGCTSWWRRSCCTSGGCRHRTYLFKHALIQDTAYQSLLRSTRQQYHQRIAQMLGTQFPQTVEMQRSWWRTTTPRRVSARRLSHTGNRQASMPSVFSQSGSGSAPHARAGVTCYPARHPERTQQE